MELRIKGFLRRLSASCAALGSASRLSLMGIVGIALLVVILCVARTAMTSPFDVTMQAVAQEVPADAVDGSRQTAADGSAEHEGRMIIVHVGGAVCNPGVYRVEAGERLIACIELAGGFTEDAYADGVNLARVVTDGEHIVVPTMAQRDAVQQESNEGGIDRPPGLISINTASAAELCSLDGIGQVLAARIIAYRERVGGFTSLSQLKSVSGIGEKRYEAIKDAICL